MHWIYGTGWGIVYAVLEESLSARPSSRGALFGAGVWATSYLTLVPMGIYEPPWRYPAGELGLDASYHLVYGTTVARLYRAAART
jgi:uncharacterized membrane protein YagU involved in acid resistance